MSHLSYSQVETLLTCGEKYRLTRVVGLQEQPAWWLMGGSAVHVTTERYDLSENPDGFDVDTEFAAALSEQLFEISHDGPIRASGRATKEWPGGEDDAWWAHHGPKFVQSWIDWRKQNPNLVLHMVNGTVPAVEVAVTAITEDGVALRGFIDRVFQDRESGDLLIVDLKTGRNSPPSSLQMDFYRYGLQSTLGINARHGGFWMARKGTLDAVHELWRTDEQIAKMLVNARILIDNELFIPHMTSMCNSCGVKEFCTAYTKPTSNHNTKVEESE
jgi:hypothetical protein